MKERTGKECKKVYCDNHKVYSNWIRNLGNSALKECMECKHAYVSQYRNTGDSYAQKEAE